MVDFVLIERTTGTLLRHGKDRVGRVFRKKKVWIWLDHLPRPPFDRDTHKLVLDVRQPDLSDMDVDVSPSANRRERWVKTPLTVQERHDRVMGHVADLDQPLMRVVEDLMARIATGQPLDRASFPAVVWEKINVRRRLRGEGDI